MTNNEKPNNQKEETISKEAFSNIEKLLTESAEITGLESVNGKFSFETFKKLPVQIKKLVDAEAKATQDKMKFRIFVDEALKVNIKHLDDAFTLVNTEIANIEVGDGTAKEIQNIVANLKETRPYLFDDPNQTSEIPNDFLTDENSGSTLDALRQKALQTGSPYDVQKYWSARRQIR